MLRWSLPLYWRCWRTPSPEGPERRRAYGFWGVAGAAGGVIGFVLGGLLTSWIGWRWIFFINVPICGAAIAAFRVLVPGRITRPTTRMRLDVPGALMVTAAIGSVIYGLGEAQSDSWTAAPVLGTLCAGPVLLTAFYLYERRSPTPLIPLQLLFRRESVGNVLGILRASAGISSPFLLPLFMQQVWGYSAGRAGVGALPMTIGFAVGARFVPRLRDHFEERPLIAVGFGLMALGGVLVVLAPAHSEYFAAMMPAMFIRSLGQALVIIPVIGFVTDGVPSDERGTVAGLYNTSQQLGSSLGLAAIATIVSAATLSAGSGVLGELHGIRIGFDVSIGLAVLAGVLTLAAMPRRSIQDESALPDELAHGGVM